MPDKLVLILCTRSCAEHDLLCSYTWNLPQTQTCMHLTRHLEGFVPVVYLLVHYSGTDWFWEKSRDWKGWLDRYVWRRMDEMPSNLACQPQLSLWRRAQWKSYSSSLLSDAINLCVKTDGAGGRSITGTNVIAHFVNLSCLPATWGQLLCCICCQVAGMCVQGERCLIKWVH